MPIIAYGEDALSFHAVFVGLSGLLRQLDDDGDPSRAIVFYRPSFGRRGSVQAGKEQPFHPSCKVTAGEGSDRRGSNRRETVIERSAASISRYT